jgi:uncharacterized membrane protein YtjA (UPF0391 family)
LLYSSPRAWQTGDAVLLIKRSGVQSRANGLLGPLEREKLMLYYALVFLVVGLIAGLLGMTGVSAVATQISWILFVIGLVLMVVHLISGRRRRTLL